MQLPPAIATTFLAIILCSPTISAQTTVGCDATCPPLGFEWDTSHLCPGSIVDSLTATRKHKICHPNQSLIFPQNELSFDEFRKPGYVTVVANYYTGCEAGRRESGVFAGIAQRIHDETGGRVNFVSSLKGGGNCVDWAGEYMILRFLSWPTSLFLYC